MAPRISYPSACVLQALARGLRYGFDVMDFTELPSGTVYPILRRFEERGWVRSEWEDSAEARADGRPRRRYYELTADGQRALTEAADRLALHARIFGGLGAPQEGR